MTREKRRADVGEARPELCAACGYTTYRDQTACCGVYWHAHACVNDHVRAVHPGRWGAWMGAFLR